MSKERLAGWVLVVGGVLMAVVLQLAGRIHLAPFMLGAVCMAAHFAQRPGDRYLEPGGLLFGFGIGTFVFHEGWLTGLMGEGAELAGVGLGMLIVWKLQTKPKWSAFGGAAMLYIGLNAMLLSSGILPPAVSAMLFSTGALWSLVPIGMGLFALRSA